VFPWTCPRANGLTHLGPMSVMLGIALRGVEQLTALSPAATLSAVRCVAADRRQIDTPAFHHALTAAAAELFCDLSDLVFSVEGLRHPPLLEVAKAIAPARSCPCPVALD